MTIWFDDGLKSVTEVAYPVLAKLGRTGIVAVIPARVGKSKIVSAKCYPCMTVEELKTLIAEGWEVASHSLTHPQPSSVGMEFCDLTLKQTEVELKDSKEWIEKNLGVTPTKFVVPRHFLRRTQMELARKYYDFVRAFPLGFPEGHIVFHHIKSESWFKRRLKRFGILEYSLYEKEGWKLLDAIKKRFR